MPRCRVCGREAEYHVPWSNAWFCREHFIQYVSRSIIRTYEKYIGYKYRRVLFAVSGGKDSVTLLHVLAPKLLGKGVDVAALFIDLGITGYSSVAEDIVRRNTDMLDIPLITIRLREYGFTIDDIAKLYYERIIRRPVCSICGMVKRYFMNKVAYENNYDLLLTGHTLDDALAFILVNLSAGKPYELVKLKPYTPGTDRLVARGKPLLFTYEAETKWFIKALNLPVLNTKCPHTPLKEGLVYEVKEFLYRLENKHPGIMRMTMKNLVDRIFPLIEKSLEKPRLVYCSKCGMPSSTDPCGFCRLRERVYKLLVKG